MNSHKRESTILEKVIGTKFLAAVSQTGGFVAGGAVRGVFASEPITDIDIFFPSEGNYDKCLAAVDDGGYSPTFTFTDSAATHISTGTEAGDIPKMRYQLISAEFGTPKQIIQKFDFTMCMGAWDPFTGGFVLDDLFLKHIAQRRLCFNANASYPICSMWRAMKFVRRGWKLPGIEAIKLALAIQKLSLVDYGELKKQLLGIDTMFLAAMTSALADKAEVRYDFGEAIEFIGNFLDDEE